MKSSNIPVVSVLMTAWNREKYIAEAIESVLASTYTNFELIIVDDCSTDKTVEIAKGYEAKDKRVKVYVNEKNLGDYPNRNRAASYVKGEYIMFVDSDDKIKSNGIYQCMKIMNKFPQCDFGIQFHNFNSSPVALNPDVAINNHFFKSPFLTIGPGGTIIRRDYLFKISQYPTKYGPANDMYFNLKAATYSSTALIPIDFVEYRRHEGQQINNFYSYLYNNYRYLRDALIELPLPIKNEQKEWLAKKNKRRFVVNITKYFLKSFNVKKTYRAIKLADFSIGDAMIGIFH